MMNQPGRWPLDGRPFWTSPERPDGQSAPGNHTHPLIVCVCVYRATITEQICFNVANQAKHGALKPSIGHSQKITFHIMTPSVCMYVCMHTS